MKKIFLALLLAPVLAFGISFEASNNISGQGDSIYVNSPTEATAQTFSGALTATSSLTVTGAGGLDVTYGVKAATGVFTNTGASSLDIGGGLNAGTGNVAIIDATGKITALSSTYLADLSGANLTTLTATNLIGTVPTGSVDLSTVTTHILTMIPSSATGTYPLSISGTVPAAGVSAGSLGGSVVASSITLAAMYGAPTLTGTNITAIPNAALVTAVIPSSATGNYPLSITGTVPQAGVNLSTVTTNHVLKAGDTMTGQLTLSGSTLTVTGNAFSVGGSTFVVSGGQTLLYGPFTGTEVNSPLKITTKSPDNSAIRITTLDSTNQDYGAYWSSVYDTRAFSTFGIRNLAVDLPLIYLATDGVYINTTGAASAPNAALDVEGGIGHYSRTIAQLLAITPLQVGVSYFCNNCSPVKMVISTGTSAGNFASADGGAFQ